MVKHTTLLEKNHAVKTVRATNSVKAITLNKTMNLQYLAVTTFQLCLSSWAATRRNSPSSSAYQNVYVPVPNLRFHVYSICVLIRIMINLTNLKSRILMESYKLNKFHVLVFGRRKEFMLMRWIDQWTARKQKKFSSCVNQDLKTVFMKFPPLEGKLEP